MLLLNINGNMCKGATRDMHHCSVASSDSAKLNQQGAEKAATRQTLVELLIFFDADTLSSNDKPTAITSSTMIVFVDKLGVTSCCLPSFVCFSSIEAH